MAAISIYLFWMAAILKYNSRPPPPPSCSAPFTCTLICIQPSTAKRPEGVAHSQSPYPLVPLSPHTPQPRFSSLTLWNCPHLCHQSRVVTWLHLTWLLNSFWFCQSLILPETFWAVDSPSFPRTGLTAPSPPVLAFYTTRSYPRASTLTLSPLPWKSHPCPVSADI